MSDQTRPLVTIGIPTYNRAGSYLKQALDSAVNQSYSNVEIVVSDNCSTDHTESLIKSYDDPRIRYFKQNENIGPINNFNYCLKQAGGDYFMQLHDDDMIDNDFIEACMKAANYSTDIGVIRTGTRVIDSENNVLQKALNTATGLSTKEFIRSWYAWKFSIYLCSTLYNTKKLKEIGGFEQNLLDDLIATIYLQNFGRVDIEDVKASFRKHDGEMTFSADIKDWCKDSLYVLDMVNDLVSDQEKIIFRQEGIKCFALLNYKFASEIKSLVERLIAYFHIFKIFKYKHLPPPVTNILYRNPLYYGLRFIKRKLV